MSEIDENRWERDAKERLQKLGPAPPFSWGKAILWWFSVPVAYFLFLVLMACAVAAGFRPNNTLAGILALGGAGVTYLWVKLVGGAIYSNPCEQNAPKCKTVIRYYAEDQGRDVQCTSCNHVWSTYVHGRRIGKSEQTAKRLQDLAVEIDHY